MSKFENKIFGGEEMGENLKEVLKKLDKKNNPKKKSSPKKRITFDLQSKKDHERWVKVCRLFGVNPELREAPSQIKNKLVQLATLEQQGLIKWEIIKK